MESKKINQLATELTPSLSDLTIIGDPSTGISKKITLSQMASLFTGTVEEYPNLASFPLVGVADTIYIALDTNVLYRWDTGLTSYVELSPNIINSLVFNDANGFDGTISLVGSVATLTITTALTTGSVGFIGASGALLQDNANFFWDDSNNRLGIGTNVPTTAIDVFGSGIIGRLNGTSTNNSFLGFASAGSNKWSIGNVQSDHRFRIYNEATTSELVSVLQTGEFGIGIANPTTKLHIDGGASALIANLDANVSVAKSISFRSDNSNRFNIEVSGTESGSNAGANFFIRRYSDAGALIDTPVTITRSTGAATFANIVYGTTADFSGVVQMGSGSQVMTNGLLKLGIAAGNSGAALQLLGWSSGTNWQIDTAYLGSGFNITPSTTSGGSTFTTPAFTILGTGSVGIGTISPQTFSNYRYLHIAGKNTTTGGVLYLSTSDNSKTSEIFLDTNGLSISSGADNLRILTNNSTRLSISGSGNFDFGGYNVQSTNNATYRQAFWGALSIMWRGAEDVYINLNHTYSSSNTNVATYTSSNGIGRLGFGAGELEYGTYNGSVSAGSAYSITKRFSITKAGRTTVSGGTANNSEYAFVVENSTPANLFLLRNDGVIFTGTTSGSPYNRTTGSVGNLFVDFDGSLYRGTASSMRFKENINDWEANGLNTILALKPKTFTYKENYYSQPQRKFLGLIAEEVAEVSNYLADFQNEDGSGQVENVRYANIVVPLIKAVQELKAELEILKAK